MFTSNRIPVYSPDYAPTFPESSEHEKIVNIIASHGLNVVIDKSSKFGYKLICQTCGLMPPETAETLHIAYQLLLAGIGDKAETLRNSALEVTTRGDVGKEDEGGISIVDFLNGRALNIETMTAENTRE